MKRRSPLIDFFKQTSEVVGGLLAANIGDIFNITVMAIALSFLGEHPESLAVLPGLAALRGSIYTSLASRVSTNLHLGLYKADYYSVAKEEWSHGLVLSFSSSIIVGLLAGSMSGINIAATLVISIISTAISWIIIMPGTIILSVLFFKRNVDPDKVSAPVITVLGDAITIPSLIAATMITTILLSHPISVTLIPGFTLTLVTIILTLKPRSRIIFIQTMTSLLFVSIIESFTGAILARWAGPRLDKQGLLPVYPSFLEDTGAIAAVIAAKTSTMAYLGVTGEKPYKFSRGEISLFTQTHVALAPSMVIIALINHIYTSTPLLTSFLIIFSSALIVAFIGGLISNILVKTIHKQEIDPDNTILPLTTSITDLLGTILLPLIGLVLSS